MGFFRGAIEASEKDNRGFAEEGANDVKIVYEKSCA